MLQNSQTDLRWKNEKLGFSPTETIGASGCKITSLGNFLGKTPSEVNAIMKAANAYVNLCQSEDTSTAKALGMAYRGKVYSEPSLCEVCLAETDNYASKGVKQHFFLWRKDGFILDPLDKKPVWRKKTYHIVSYRLFALNQDLSKVSAWALPSVKKAIEKKIATQWDNPQEIVATETLAYIFKNCNLISTVLPGGMTKEQVVTMLDKQNLLPKA